MSTLHLTQDGPNAGSPYCGRFRLTSDRYEHLGWSLADWQRQADDPELCRGCRRYSGIVGLIGRAERRRRR